jgi:glucose-6-phosphate isomerase
MRIIFLEIYSLEIGSYLPKRQKVMKNITFNYSNTHVSTKILAHLNHQLETEIDQIINAQIHTYETPYASAYLPFDIEILKECTLLAQQKLQLKPMALIIIGIGGSNLGTAALLEALNGKFYNETQPLKVYFADTLDPDTTNHIIAQTKAILKAENNIIVTVISKSGTTLETIAHYEVFLEILKKYRPLTYHQYIVTITDLNSPLWIHAQQEKYSCLTLPRNVGGRYSVFSAVGLFPLLLCRIDAESLLKGAQDGFALCTKKDISCNPATLSASTLATLYAKGYYIHDIFLFCTELESFGKWYRQLIGESIGKEYNNQKKRVNIGITPTVSIGSTDLHSVAQLYLAGPHNRFTTFISLANNECNVIIPHSNNSNIPDMNIEGKKYTFLMSAILQGTQQAYSETNNPFATIILPQKNAYYMGLLMQIKMLEIMYLGFLMDINPFDQPNVEIYKEKTQKIIHAKK